MQSTFSFTNTTNRTTSVPVTEIDIDDYAMREDEPESCTITNTTTNMDQPELVTYQCGTLKRIPTKNTNLYPPTVEGGVQYGIRIDELLRVQTDDGDTLYDLPIVATLTFKHPSNAAITSGHVETVLSRLLGCLYKDESTTRINDMMRLAIRPKNS